LTEEIEPDYKQVFKLFKDVILLPLTLILILFKKKELSDLFNPIKDLWEYFWDAKFTAILVISNVLFFLFTVVYVGTMPEAQQETFSKRYLLDGPSNLLSLNIVPFVVSWFVHSDWSHLLGNVLFLFILGRVVEKNFGPMKFALIYFGSAVISGVVDDLVHISDMTYFSSGASGAIAGLASAAMLVEPFYLVCVLLIPVPVFLFGWLQVYSDVSGVLNPSSESTIANFAHLGGFFAITIIVFFMSSEEKSKLLRGLLINLFTLAVLVALWWYTSK